MTKTLPSLSERSIAYARMADALSHLGDTWRDWPDLSECARAVGLSPHHFQREFTRWAGISPKQYQAALAHAEAGDLLRQGASVLDTALETGLSGPSRLHDLFIAHEGLTPGEAKSGGEGADLVMGEADTPFGTAILVISPRGLCGLGFADDGADAKSGFEHPGYGKEAVKADFANRYPNASIRLDNNEALIWARRIFDGGEPVPVALYGTPFRRQIWRALLDIPYGVLFAVLIGFTTLIPYASAITIVFVSVVLAVQDPRTGLELLAAAIVVGQLVDQVIQPRLMGSIVGLQPAWLLIALPLGARVGALFGFGDLLGLLLAVPVASCIKSLADAARTDGASPQLMRPESLPGPAGP